MKKLLVVESPAKAKTIEKYLGTGFSVKSSVGHIRQIPPKDSKAIDIKNNFETIYEIDPEKTKTVAELKKAAKSADEVLLATDPDREGEAIAWHLAEVLGLKIPKTKRVTYQEVTKEAIEEAIANPRTIDMNLVSAQQARQILDRIVGYELSPVVWRKVPGGKSAGRVQSPALRLIVEREREIENFANESNFKVTGVFTPETRLEAKLDTDFDTEKAAHDFLTHIINAKYLISDINSSNGSKNPSAPFTTSTLQQEANAKFGYSARTTMTAAQKLYQAGKITYMRTDSVNLSNQALGQIGNYIEKTFGKNYLKIRKYATKNANAQEAHEAIRPTNISVEKGSSNAYDQKLYDLIRRRTLASQMAQAQIEITNIVISIRDERRETRNEKFVAKGEVILFDGFLKVYGSQKENQLPKLTVGDELMAEKIVARQNFAKPPARYTEGSLVKKLESLGIGRPSTYATIMEGIQKRDYVRKGDGEGKEREIIELILGEPDNASSQTIRGYDRDLATSPVTTGARSVSENLASSGSTLITRQVVTEKTGADRGKLIPTDIGKVLSDFLTNYFNGVVDYDWTAKIEAQLDEIAAGKYDKVKMLNGFYKPFHSEIIKSAGIDRKTVVNMRKIGTDPKTKKPIFARLGRFGPMLQRGEGEKDDEKPQFAPLPADATLETVDLEQALKAFELPRSVGKTADGQEILANIGRFGPYIKVDKLFVSIKPLDPHKITHAEAVELYEQKLKTEAEKNIADFGKIKVLNGRYGPYITDGVKNAKIPKDTDPKKLTEAAATKILESAPAKKRRFPKRKAS